MKNQKNSPVKNEAFYLSKIIKIRTDAGVLGIINKQESLQAELTKIKEKIRSLYEPENHPQQPTHCDTDDAQALIDGATIDDLPGDSIESQRASLTRQRQAIEKAIPQLNIERGKAERKVCKRICDEIGPLATKKIEQLISAYEIVQAAIKDCDALWQTLEENGIVANSRPAFWCLWPFDQFIKFGGQGLRPLAKNILDRKKYLKDHENEK